MHVDRVGKRTEFWLGWVKGKPHYEPTDLEG